MLLRRRDTGTSMHNLEMRFWRSFNGVRMRMKIRQERLEHCR